MRLLVTGGAGFIGSNFVRWVLQCGISKKDEKEIRLSSQIERICVLDALTYAGNLANLDGLTDDPRFLFVKGNICDDVAVQTVLQDEQLDAIINFAAESHVDRSIVDPKAFVRTNLEGTQVLLSRAREIGVKKFIQVSTDEVYGSLGAEGRFNENSPLRPSSAYAASKAGADLLALAVFHTYKFPISISRCTNNYGPYQFPEKLIPLFITNALHNEPLPLYGDGKNVRSWIHVEDHARALLFLLHQAKPGEVYNIGGGSDCERENQEVTREILRILEKPESLIRPVSDRLGHDRRYAVDSSKMQQEFGWTPQIDFMTGLARTVEWYLENKNWWESVKSGEYQRFYDLYYGRDLGNRLERI